MSTAAIIVAGGTGRRMGQPKQFLELGGRPMLQRTVEAFDRCSLIDEIVVVVNEGDRKRVEAFGAAKVRTVVAAGAERCDSVRNGLLALSGAVDLVAIHDGARPFVEQDIIEQVIKAAAESGAAIVAVPVVDTIKMTNDQCQMTNVGCIIQKTVDRSRLWAAQTPQVFRKELVLKAYEQTVRTGVTDDATLVERMGVPVKLVRGSYRNIKVTTLDDLPVAAAILKELEGK